MADSLSLLRQITIEDKPIEERDDQIIFNEFSWNKNSLTNFISYSADRNEKEYYSLGCLLYFLKNEHLKHPEYVLQAGGNTNLTIFFGNKIFKMLLPFDKILRSFILPFDDIFR